jgi:hypothetical protein
MASDAAKIRPMDDDRVHDVQRDELLEAGPLALCAVVVSTVLAIWSWRAGWELFGAANWWIWLVVAVPSALIALAFFVEPRRMGLDHLRRKLVIRLLELLAVGNLSVIVCVTVSLVHWKPAALQLLASAVAVLITNAIAFTLAFWELDDGGPVARSLAARRRHPDFQFPQDENPQLAPDGWTPAIWDYLYIAVTNSIAFSPTDAMPLTHRAKLFMGVEAAVSAATILVVAARAINLLGS